MRWSRKAIAAPRASSPRATWPRSIASREIFGTGLPASRGSTTGMALLPCKPRYHGPHLFADVTEIEKQHEENGMNGGADAVHRGRHGEIRADDRRRRAGQIEIEQNAGADEEGAREEFADLFPVDGHANIPCAGKIPQRAVTSSRSNRGVLADERHDALEHVAGLGQVRRMAGGALHLDIVQRDVAAGFFVIGDEALRLVAGKARIGVLVVVHDVAAALEPDRRRQLQLLATL